MIARIWHGWTIPENSDIYEMMLKSAIFVNIQKHGMRVFYKFNSCVETLEMK